MEHRPNQPERPPSRRVHTGLRHRLPIHTLSPKPLSRVLTLSRKSPSLRVPMVRLRLNPPNPIPMRLSRKTPMRSLRLPPRKTPMRSLRPRKTPTRSLRAPPITPMRSLRAPPITPMRSLRRLSPILMHSQRPRKTPMRSPTRLSRIPMGNLSPIRMQLRLRILTHSHKAPSRTPMGKHKRPMRSRQAPTILLQG